MVPRRYLRSRPFSFQIQFVITDSKLSLGEIGNMRAFLDRLQRAGENFDVADLESKTALVLRRNDDLLKGVAAQKKSFQVGAI